MFKLSKDIVSMESHIAPEGSKVDSKSVIYVQSYTVKTLTSQYKVPKRFGILSIDAEGYSNKVSIGVNFHPDFTQTMVPQLNVVPTKCLPNLNSS